MDKKALYDLVNQRFTEILKELGIQIDPTKDLTKVLKKMDDLIDELDGIKK